MSIYIMSLVRTLVRPRRYLFEAPFFEKKGPFLGRDLFCSSNNKNKKKHQNEAPFFEKKGPFLGEKGTFFVHVII